ncbi:MAG: hypothetical protein QNK11_06275 [Legionella sp.]|nr:hypothetical protein [Legionella sp.]
MENKVYRTKDGGETWGEPHLLSHGIYSPYAQPPACLSYPLKLSFPRRRETIFRLTRMKNNLIEQSNSQWLN